MDKKQTNLETEMLTVVKKWHEKPMITSCDQIPEKPGLYVIGHVYRYLALEFYREFIYIGETNNLRRRLEEHDPVNEKKQDLRNYVRKHLCDIKCWYCFIPKSNLLEGQELLIKQFTPRFNVQLNSQGKNHDRRQRDRRQRI